MSHQSSTQPQHHLWLEIQEMDVMKCLSNSTAQVDKTVNATLFSFRFKDILRILKMFYHVCLLFVKSKWSTKAIPRPLCFITTDDKFFSTLFSNQKQLWVARTHFPARYNGLMYFPWALIGSFDITASTLIGQSIRVVDQLGTGISPFWNCWCFPE